MTDKLNLNSKRVQQVFQEILGASESGKAAAALRVQEETVRHASEIITAVSEGCGIGYHRLAAGTESFEVFTQFLHGCHPAGEMVQIDIDHCNLLVIGRLLKRPFNR